MKKVIIIGIVVSLVLMIVGGYAIVDHMFPVAPAITYPNAGDILTITAMQNHDLSTAVTVSDDILQCLDNAEPTRQWSIQDYPTVKAYYTVEVETEDRLYRYFVYTEGRQVYIEHPYEGVYKTNRQTLDLIAAYFQK